MLGGWWSGSLKVFHTQDEYEEDVDLDLNASNNLKCPSLILMFWTLRILQTWIQLSRFFNLVSFLPMGRNLTSHIFFVYCSDHPFSPLCRPTGPTQCYALAQGLSGVLDLLPSLLKLSFGNQVLVV